MRQGIVAIIPARGGSRGIPRKNTRLLAGKPLLAYSIEVALGSRFIDRVLVSTEDEEIARIAANFGAEIVKRPEALARDDTPSIPVFQHVIECLESGEDYQADTIVILQPTSPLRAVQDVDNAISLFRNAKCYSVVSVCELEHPLDWAYIVDNGKLKPVIQTEKRVTRRQDAPKVYRLNGAVYVASKYTMMTQNSLIGEDTRPIMMPPERSVDIDIELDFRLAEILISNA